MKRKEKISKFKPVKLASILLIFIFINCSSGLDALFLKNVDVNNRVEDSYKDILAFRFLENDNTGIIFSDITGIIGDSTVDVTVPFETDVSSLVPAITINGDSIDPTGVGGIDFTGGSEIFSVSAADLSTKEYVVTVNVAASDDKDITSFKFLEADNSGIILSDIAGTVGPATVNLTVPFGTDVTSLVPSIGISGDSIVPTGVGGIDFSTPVVFTVTAADLSTKDYTVTVTLSSASNDADLLDITLSDGTLSPEFDPAITSYSVSVTNDVTEITVTGTANDVSATVDNNPVSPASLSVGANVVTLTCTAEDGTTTKDYTLTVTRAASSDADLSGITLSDGTLSPVFLSSLTSYSVNVSNDVTEITITGTANHGSATVSNGPVSPVSLSVGANVVTVTCTAEDGTTTKEYTVTVTRDPSSDADLSNISLSVGTLSPVFDAGITSYSVSVGNDVTGITLTGTANDVSATVDNNPVNPVSLSVGANVVTITCTAEDGTTTKDYTVTVTRISNDADLSNITLSAGTLSPVFDPGTTSYSVSVTSDVTEITVTGTANHVSATVGNNPINPASLSVGANVITITCTAEDGTTTKDYTVTVTRVLSSDADLSNISLSAGTLSPVFNAGTTSYSVSVANDITEISVTGTANHGFATVGNNPVNPASLSVGANVITITCTAEDGTTTKDYTVTVTRASSSDANLSDITLSVGTLSPVFGPGITSYSVNVANDVTEITVSGTANHGSATVENNPVNPASLSVGDNVVTVTCTAEDGITTKDYTVTVTVAATASWPKRMGGQLKDEGTSITTDDSGNVFVTGFVNGNADLNGDGDSADGGAEDSTGYGLIDAYITKFDSSGVYQWSKRIGGASNDYGMSIITDSNGAAIVTGYVEGNADLNGDGDMADEGETSIEEPSADFFISKFALDGTPSWTKRLEGSGEFINYDNGYGVATDSLNNIFVTGRISGSIDLNGDAKFKADGESPTGYGKSDVIIIKYDPNGNYLWAKRLGGIGVDIGYDIVVDPLDNVIAIGIVEGDADLNGDGDFIDAGGEDSTGFGNYDTFISKFDSDGIFQWSKRLGSPNSVMGQGVASDSSGNIIITGYLFGEGDLNGNGTLTDEYESAIYGNSNDIFISKFDLDGNPLWVKRLGGESGDCGKAVTIDSLDNIIITGYLFEDADLNGDGDFLDAWESPSGFGLNDIIISKFDPDGIHQWAKRLGKTNGEIGFSITTNASNDVIVSGSINGNGDLTGDGDVDDAGEDSTGYTDNDVFITIFDSNGNF